MLMQVIQSYMASKKVIQGGVLDKGILDQLSGQVGNIMFKKNGVCYHVLEKTGKKNPVQRVRRRN